VNYRSLVIIAQKKLLSTQKYGTTNKRKAKPQAFRRFLTISRFYFEKMTLFLKNDEYICGLKMSKYTIY